MDAALIVLGVVAAAAVAGIVWLLVEKGRLAARAQVAESEARAAQERRDGAERALAELKGAIDEWTRRLTTAQAEQARLGEALQREQAAREEERGRAAREVEGAVENERRLHAEELRRLESVHAEKLAAVQEARKEIEAKLAAFDQKMKESFGALAGEALNRSSESFLKLAETKLAAAQQKNEQELEKKRAEVDQLLRPISDTLKRADEKLASIGSQWATDRASLVEQIKGVATQNEGLRAETMKLARALSKPEVRGRYGELQLRRVAELAGMTAYCDFTEQASQRDDAGRLLRPDMVVKLPNERTIAVDAKCNTYAYVQAAEAADEAQREEHLERFARHVSEQVAALSKKNYWAELDGSPDFVVMFIPGDQFLDAALARRSDLLERAAEQGVILASPSTLIGLLRAVAVGWREKRIEEQARELFDLGRELHDRAATAFASIAGVGKALTAAVERYNRFVGSYESRLEPTLRKFEEAGVKSGKELPEVAGVGAVVRQVEIEAKPAGLLEAAE